MKKITISFLFIAVAIITFIACRKNESTSKNPNELTVNEAKEWWWGTFRKSSEYKQIDKNSDYYRIIKKVNGLENTLAGFGKTPNWAKAISYKVGNFSVVELPLFYSRKVNILGDASNLDINQKQKAIASILEKLILIKSKNGKIDVRIQTITPTFEYATANNFDVTKNTFNNIDKNFSGVIEVRKWDESLIINRKIENGKIKKIKKTSLFPTNNAREGDIIPNCPPDDNSCPNPTPNEIFYHVCFEQHPLSGDDVGVVACSHGSGLNTYACTYYTCPDGDSSPTEDCTTNLNFSSFEECMCALYNVGCPDNGGGDEDESCNNAFAECIGILNETVNKTGATTIESTVNTEKKKVGWVFYEITQMLGSSKWTLSSYEMAEIEKDPVSRNWFFTSFNHDDVKKDGSVWCGNVTYNIIEAKANIVAGNILKAYSKVKFDIEFTYSCVIPKTVSKSITQDIDWTANEVKNL